MEFDNLVEKAKSGLDIVCKKTEQTVEISKLRLKKASLETKLSKAFESLGKIYYQSVKNAEEPDADEVNLITEDITKKTEQIKKLKRMIEQIKG